MVKPNVGGSGAGIVRFDREEELRAAVEANSIAPSVDGTWLVQEYHRPRGGSIVRVGTPARIAEQLDGFARAGVGLTLLQFSPQAEEMERFAAEVMPLLRGSAAS